MHNFHSKFDSFSKFILEASRFCCLSSRFFSIFLSRKAEGSSTFLGVFSGAVARESTSTLISPIMSTNWIAESLLANTSASLILIFRGGGLFLIYISSNICCSLSFFFYSWAFFLSGSSMSTVGTITGLSGALELKGYFRQLGGGK